MLGSGSLRLLLLECLFCCGGYGWRVSLGSSWKSVQLGGLDMALCLIMRSCVNAVFSDNLDIHFSSSRSFKIGGVLLLPHIVVLDNFDHGLGETSMLGY